jgi:FAD/FMN-containing dehydrogenase
MRHQALLVATLTLATGCGSVPGLTGAGQVTGAFAASRVVNDVSGLNPTDVAQVLTLPSDPARAEETLRGTFAFARKHKLPVSLGGAQHTMGGQTLAAGGIYVDTLPLAHMSLDKARRTLHVGAGARWSAVLPYLDKAGCSVAVMQSNNPFSIGGSLGANCHGWQTGRAPLVSTVKSMRVMLTDGRVQTASREANAELFSLVPGGYGCIGAVLDVDLEVVPNVTYKLKPYHVASRDYAATFRKYARQPGVQMVYGRLSVAPQGFLQDAVLNTLTVEPGAGAPAMRPKSRSPLDEVKRAIFRWQVGNGFAKHIRWEAEKRFSEMLGKETVTRNEILDEGIELYANEDPTRTDILQEYFVPLDRFADFIERARVIIPRHEGDLLNVTVRDLVKDPDAFMRYADQDMLSLVMLFNHEKTAAADAKLAPMTRELIDAALAVGGRYYLPYRLHATRAQFERAYPQAERFFALKRKYDPTETLQNAFYQTYGKR